MCIIIAKNKGLNVPNNEILKNCWDNNSDGGGYMYNDGHTVHIHKGFMTYKAFKSHLEKTSKNVDLQNCDLVIHFRIATHGGVNAECTHPFTLSKNIDVQKRLHCKASIGVAHNGIIRNVDDYKTHSDTMEYIKSYLYPMYYLDNNFYTKEYIRTAIEVQIGSKLVIMDKDRLYTIGAYVEHEQVLYSNSGYIKYDYSKYYNSSLSEKDYVYSEYDGMFLTKVNADIIKASDKSKVDKQAIYYVDEYTDVYVLLADGNFKYKDTLYIKDKHSIPTQWTDFVSYDDIVF